VSRNDNSFLYRPNVILAAACGIVFAVRSDVSLVAGFFVCGFHVSFIMVHLPPYLGDIGVPAAYAAWALGIIGLFKTIGAFIGVRLGGYLFETTGSCDVMWWLATALSLVVAALHWPIVETLVPRFAEPAHA
jgi:fucose permease